MLSTPADLPTPLRDLLALSAAVDGETIVFRPDDRIAFVSASAAQRYPFVDFAAGVSYEDLFWSTLRHGLISRAGLRLAPSDHLAMARSVRIANDALDFQKSYGNTHLLCHHRRLPDGWSAQVRVDLGNSRLHGLIDATHPLNLLEAMRHVQLATRLHAALDRLPVGVLFLDRTRRILWRNAAAAEDIANARALIDEGGRLYPRDRRARTAFVGGLSAVLDGDLPRFVACPDGDRTRLLSLSRAPIPDEALVLLAPTDAPDASIVEALATLGLSPAECRIAAAIGSGDGPAAVATALGRQESTVRRQLAAVYAKLSTNTGVASQRALARLIAQVASIAGISRRSLH